MIRTMRSWLGAGAVLLVATAALAAQEQDGNIPSGLPPTTLEQQATALDHRVVELQHEILAARRNGDQAGVERAQKELKTVQGQRVEAWRALGQLP